MMHTLLTIVPALKPKNPAGTVAVFGEQFADDVRLTLKTQPALPVRFAKR